jgi:hypothetical protein
LIPNDVVSVVSDVASEASTLAIEKEITIGTELPAAPARCDKVTTSNPFPATRPWFTTRLHRAASTCTR